MLITTLVNSPAAGGEGKDEDQGDEHVVMPRKRRKSLHEEAYIDPTLRPMNSHAAAPVGASLGNAGLRNNINSLPNSPHLDNASGGGDSSRSLSPGTTFEAKSINLPAYSYWRSARRQKPASQPRDDRKNSSGSLSTSQKLDSVSPRKRLIDSLGTADNRGSEAFMPMSHYMPKPLYPSDEANSTSARRRLARKASESRTCDSGHLRRSPPPPTPSSMLRSSGVTYSRQRSFLNDSLSLTDFENHDVMNSHEFEPKTKSLNISSSRISPEEDDAHDSKPVRSIHELRRAGDNARFREVIDSIFEDIEDRYNSKSGRCCALAELCGKLLDSQFVHRFSEQGFDERLVNCTLNDLDLVSASLALSAHRLIIVGGHTSRVFSDSLWARILELPTALLDTEDDILILARGPSIGLSKTAQASIRDVRSHLLPAIGSPSPCLSPQLLALECIKSSLVVLRERGHTIRPFPTLLLGKLIDLVAENAIKDLNSSAPKGQLQFLDRVFLILENYSVISGPFDYNHCRCFRRLVHFHQVLILDHCDRRQVSISYIRVILNITNKEPTLCDSFATPDIVCGLANIVTTEFRDISRELCDQDNGTLNEVILALGALINLAEKTKQSRAILISSNNRAVSFFHQLLEQFSGRVRTMDQVRRQLLPIDVL